MTTVPAGKTRVMVAQNFSTPSVLSEGFGGQTVADEGGGPFSFNETKSVIDPNSNPVPISVLDTEGAMEEDIEGNVSDDVSMREGEEEQLAPKENRKTLTSYIFEKLQSYGYPGRRLQEFKSEFVKESVSPEGVKDIEVVIPDKKYPDERGFTDTIENEELKSIAHEVNQAFGLNFNGADRAGGKWTIKFTSANIANPDEGISHDTLDQVYGRPDKGSQLGKPGQTSQPRQKPAIESKPLVRASTIREIIKDEKSKIVQKLQKMNGE